jgi:hypothetical protein
MIGIPLQIAGFSMCAFAVGVLVSWALKGRAIR